jgi:hypothetical protein
MNCPQDILSYFLPNYIGININDYMGIMWDNSIYWYNFKIRYYRPGTKPPEINYISLDTPHIFYTWFDRDSNTIHMSERFIDGNRSESYYNGKFLYNIIINTDCTMYKSYIEGRFYKQDEISNISHEYQFYLNDRRFHL